ncbi:MAG TPA: hypothetical protein VF145_00135, partial [Chitinophagaceae bacterium]
MHIPPASNQLSPAASPQTERSFLRTAITLAAISIVVSAAVMAGWILNIRELTSISPLWTGMKVNSAIAFLLLAAAVVIAGSSSGNKKLVRLFATIVFAIAALTIFQDLSGNDLGIDELFFTDNTSIGTIHPGRMSPFTAINFMVLAACLWMTISRQRRYRWLSQLCCLLVLLISMFNFDGYIFGVDALYRNFEINQMAVLTASLFMMLAASIAFINPGEGIVSVFTRKTRASKVALRQLMFITVLILLAGVLIFNGEKAGYYT